MMVKYQNKKGVMGVYLYYTLDMLGGNRMIANYNPKGILIVFGTNIRKVREAKGMKIHEVAEIAQYDRGCLSRLEYGEQNIKVKTAIKIAKTLNISFPALFSRNFMDGNKEHPELQVDNTYIEDDFIKVFAENFWKSIKTQGYSEMTVVETIGIPNSSVSKIKNGKYDNPTLTTLYGMSLVAGIDMYSLFSRL